MAPVPDGVIEGSEIRVFDWDAVVMEVPTEGFPRVVEGIGRMIEVEEMIPETSGELELTDGEDVDRSSLEEAESGTGTRIIA